ncbi:Integral membrane protein DGCR2/IDD [Myotis brandtii]|uniref:Integral membrane protein DGCR2/IDD n=1 Tax=Myotis brandtii TaxID=109478 RepID=S7NB23_MYOBR|nr:Integral membrane protein DGCR2/IDD [Myotis brandtii]
MLPSHQAPELPQCASLAAAQEALPAPVFVDCQDCLGNGNSLFDSMASGMRLIVSCISSFLILSLLLFMVHRLRQRRRERIESLIGANLHHFNLGRRIPGFDYGPDGFGTGLTPLHLSDDGEGGTFHFHDPPPPYTAYKYPDIDQPDDPPPPYEASINPDSVFYDPAGASPTGRGSSLSPTTWSAGPESQGSSPAHRAVNSASFQPAVAVSGFPFKVELPLVGCQALPRGAGADDC